MIRLLAVLFVSIYLSACTINPTPVGISRGETDDLSQINHKGSPHISRGKFVEDYTLHIVEHVRCETRDALVRAAAKLIRDTNRVQGIGYGPTVDLADTLLKEPWKSSKFQVWDIDPLAYTQAYLFLGSSIGFRFDLTTTETNLASIDPNLSPSGGAHSLSLGIGTQSIDGSRKNNRKFDEITSSFQDFQKKRCYYDGNLQKMRISQLPNLYYPMQGSINLQKSISTYIGFALSDIPEAERFGLARSAMMSVLSSNEEAKYLTLEKFENLLLDVRGCGETESPICNAKKLCYEDIVKKFGEVYLTKFYKAKGNASLSMTDKFTFTTTLKYGANPSIEFSPMSGSFKLKQLSFGLTGSRMDSHDLTAVFVGAKPKSPEKKTQKIPLVKNNYASLVAEIDTGVKEKPKKAEACETVFPATQQSIAQRNSTIRNVRMAAPARQLFPELNRSDTEIIQSENTVRRLINEDRLDSIQESLDRLSEPLQ